MYRVSSIVAVLFVLFAGQVCLAEGIPPGKYTWRGLVVKRNNGQPAIFFGRGCHSFPSKLHKQLQPHVGKFVQVDFVRVNDPRVFSFVGSVIDRIERITVLADRPEVLPVVVKLAPGKQTFAPGEPLQMSVTVTNKTGQNYSLPWYTAATSLCQDYQEKLVFESELHYLSKHPDLKQLAMLKPGESVHYTVTCRRMPRPGTYQLLHSLQAPRDDGLSLQSKIHTVTILPPANDAEALKALRSWLDRVAPEYKAEVAADLLKKGDPRGRDVLLRLLSSGKYADPNAISYSLYRFLWQHGGKEGEAALLKRISKQTRQDPALRTIELVYLSKNRVALLQQLLNDRHPTRRDISGWVDQPRICDITADWLAGYTGGKIRFPHAGTEKERDAAVQRVREQLKQRPEFFEVLSKSYR